MKSITTMMLTSVLLAVAGCSGGDSDAGSKGEHVWKEQTETMDKARQVEDVIQKQAEEQRQKVKDLD